MLVQNLGQFQMRNRMRAKPRFTSTFPDAYSCLVQANPSTRYFVMFDVDDKPIIIAPYSLEKGYPVLSFVEGMTATIDLLLYKLLQDYPVLLIDDAEGLSLEGVLFGVAAANINNPTILLECPLIVDETGRETRHPWSSYKWAQLKSYEDRGIGVLGILDRRFGT